MRRLTDTKGPRYLAIKREILSKIERGTWPIGYRLPTEEELEQTYGVSRGTVRQALAQLDRDGYLSRTARKGTFVTRVTPKLRKHMGQIVSHTQQLLSAGYEPSTRVIEAGLIRAGGTAGRIAEAFGLPPDGQIVHIKRLRLANAQPLSIQSVFLLPEKCQGILDQDLTCLFELYERQYGKKMLCADEILRVSVATDAEAALLQMNPGAPVVNRDRVSFDQTDEAFEVLHSVDRADWFIYSYAIVADLTKSPGLSAADGTSQSSLVDFDPEEMRLPSGDREMARPATKRPGDGSGNGAESGSFRPGCVR